MQNHFDNIEETVERIEKSRHRRALRLLGAGLIICVGFAAAILTGLGLYGAHWRASLNRQIQTIRHDGLPIAVQQLDAWYSTPKDGRNAAPALLALFNESPPDLFLAMPDDAWRALPLIVRGNVPEAGTPLSAETQALAKRYLARYGNRLDVLRAAVDLGEARFPVDLTRNSTLRPPHLDAMRTAGATLLLEAMIEADSGNSDAAIRDLIAALTLSDLLREEPLLVSQFTRVAIRGQAVLVAEWIVGRSPLTDAQLSRMQQAFQNEQDRNIWFRALVGDRCLVLSIANSIKGTSQSLGELAELHPLEEIQTLVGGPSRDLSLFLRGTRRLIDVSSLAPPLRARALRAFRQEAPWRVNTLLSLTPMVYTTNYLPAIADFGSEFDMDAAKMSVVATALAVVRYRLATDEFPESIDALKPEYMKDVPFDPFTGEPMRYVADSNGFVVYSIGEDLVDDGGKAPRLRPSATYRYQGDVAFRYRNVAGLPLSGVAPSTTSAF